MLEADIVFGIITLGVFLPEQMKLVPWTLVVRDLGLSNTLTALQLQALGVELGLAALPRPLLRGGLAHGPASAAKCNARGGRHHDSFSCRPA